MLRSLVGSEMCIRDSYTCAPNPAVDVSKGLVAYLLKNGKSQRIVLKEGTISVSLIMSDPPALFDTDTFVLSVAGALELTDPTRIVVDNITAVASSSSVHRGFVAKSDTAGTKVDFSILPLPPIYYTSQAARLDASIGNATLEVSETLLQTTTYIQEQLNTLSSTSSSSTNSTSFAPIAAMLLVATGASSSSVVVSSQQAPPASQYDDPDDDSVFAGLSATTIGAIAGGCIAVVLVGVIVGVVVYRKQRASRHANTVKGSMNFQQEDHLGEEMIPADVTPLHHHTDEYVAA
eukprot:TRINITY_DN3928_c0_g1_i2.p1 TRINITY_DN3928_c0_g1~~TRINITY_DN3928_c0_g1_i2.p1  ORF type:complete len:341 (-),score=89.46 TRINITY_DN3928_c0_g1_i2:435-1307(-)